MRRLEGRWQSSFSYLSPRKGRLGKTHKMVFLPILLVEPNVRNHTKGKIKIFPLSQRISPALKRGAVGKNYDLGLSLLSE